MAEQLEPLTPALRLTPSTTRARSQSPRRARSPERRHQFLALELDPLLSNLSPQSTLRALSVADAVPSDGKTPADALTRSIASASTLERAFGIRAALTGQKLREWYAELQAWSWPSKHGAGLGKGFIPPSSCATNAGESQTYLGSLRSEAVEQYENRIEEIRDDMDALDVEALKEHVLNAHIPSRSRPISSQSTLSIEVTPLSYVQLSDFTAVVTATILQALPVLSKLNRLLAAWDVRLIVLRQIPDLLQGLRDVQSSIGIALIRLQRGVLPDIDDPQFSKESFSLARSVLERRVLTLAGQMDRILDELEGRSDSLPENWIDEMEKIEADFAMWASQAQRMANENDWKRSFQIQTLSTPKPRILVPARSDDTPVLLPPMNLGPPETPTQASYLQVLDNTKPPSDLIATPVSLKTQQPAYKSAAHTTFADAKTPQPKLAQAQTIKAGALNPLCLSIEERSPSVSGVPTAQQAENGSMPRSQIATTKSEQNSTALEFPMQTAVEGPHTTLQDVGDIQSPEYAGKSEMSHHSPNVVKAKICNIENGARRLSEPKCTPKHSKRTPGSTDLALELSVDSKSYNFNDSNTESEGSLAQQANSSIDSATTPSTAEKFSQTLVSINAPIDKSAGRQFPTPCSEQDQNQSHHGSTSDENTSSSSPFTPEFPDSPRGSTPSIIGSSRLPSPVLPTPPSSNRPITPSNAHRSVMPSLTIKSASYQPYITPKKTPEDNLERKISSILTTIPGDIQLSSTPIHTNKGVKPGSSLQVEQRTNRTQSNSPSSTRPTTPTTTLTLTPADHRPKRRLRSEDDNPVRLYHLHRGGKLPPLKLFVRMVGEEGERVMVRVGGGWADLGEYLREYVMHHRRGKMSESKLEVHEVPNASPPYRSSPPHHRSPGRTINNGRTTPVSRPGSPYDCRPPSPLAIRKTRLSNASAATRPTLTAANVEKASRAAEPGYIYLPRRRLSISSTASMFANSTPLGLAGPNPKSRNVAISPESEAWVEDMMGQARKTSETLRSKISTGSLRGYRPSPMSEHAPQFRSRVDSGTRRVSDFTGTSNTSSGPANKRVFLKGMGKNKG